MDICKVVVLERDWPKVSPLLFDGQGRKKGDVFSIDTWPGGPFEVVFLHAEDAQALSDLITPWRV